MERGGGGGGGGGGLCPLRSPLPPPPKITTGCTYFSAAAVFPAKCFACAHVQLLRHYVRMRTPWKNPLAPPPGNHTSTAASIMAVNTRKKRCCCNICDVGFDFPSKLVRYFASSRHKLLEERYPATPVNHSMPCSHEDDEVFRLHNDCCLVFQNHVPYSL